MSRISHAARVERLKRQLQGAPVVIVRFPDWFLALRAEAERSRAPSESAEDLGSRSAGTEPDR